MFAHCLSFYSVWYFSYLCLLWTCGTGFLLYLTFCFSTQESCVSLREKRGKSPYQKRVSCVSFLFDITVVNFCFSDINSTHAILLLDNLQVSITISLRFFSISFELDDWPISWSFRWVQPNSYFPLTPFSFQFTGNDTSQRILQWVM